MPAAEPVTIDLSQCQYEYQDLWTTQDDLNQVRPTSLTYQGKELTLGTDYTISYQGTARSTVTDLGTAGNYTMLLTGTGNYSGTLALSFRVASGTSVNTLTASSIKAQKYTGKALTPKLTLKDPMTRKTLKSGTHYTLTYENNVNAGTASIVIQGIEANGYVGTRRVTFTIQPCEIKKVNAKIWTKRSITPAQHRHPGSLSLTKRWAWYKGEITRSATVPIPAKEKGSSRLPGSATL